jgi:hypothetical protein
MWRGPPAGGPAAWQRRVVLMYCDEPKVENSRLLHFISESEIGTHAL